MITAYIAIGSNLADPVSQAKSAIDALKTLPKSRLLVASQLYSSSPMGPQD
ncbi:2-amino-4-hydroxy-6-hydroxymethyldihydropteridine pyrophosphokinase, partial [Vibrio vulnificus]